MSKRIFYQVSDLWGCGYYRCYLPCAHCAPDLLTEDIELVLDTKLAGNDRYDVYVFHRIITEQFWPHFKWLREQKGVRIVMQLDDLWTGLPGWNPNYGKYDAADFARLEESLDLADWIIV